MTEPGAATPRRTLGGLTKKVGMPADPSTSRLRRDLRSTESLVDDPTPTSPANDSDAGPEDNQASSRAAGQLDLPRYLQLVRKESRLRRDQADWLGREVRRINQARLGRAGSVGERITDNTLIRVAVDLLMSRTADLVGTTEDELRDSVSP